MYINSFMGGFALGMGFIGFIAMLANRKGTGGHIEPSQPWPQKEN